MSDYPRFFSKNYVAPKVIDFQKDLSNIIVTHGDNLKQFLFDRNLNTQWKSGTGSRDDEGQIDNCDDDPVAWISADSEVTVTRDNTIKHEGSASVRIQTSGTWAGGLMAYKNLPLSI